MSLTATRIINTARAELGTKEKPQNDVKYNTFYYGQEVNGPEFPWCATFISWIAKKADATSIIPKHAYTPAGAAWFKNRGQWHTSPKRGDLAYFEFPGMNRISHVGIVEAVRSDGSIISIEGNTDVHGSRTGGRVMRKVRSRSLVAGFGRPRYEREEVFISHTLGVGSPYENEVKALQLRLNKVMGTKLAVDGDFGDSTASVVRQFKAKSKNLLLKKDKGNSTVGKLTITSLGLTWKGK